MLTQAALNDLINRAQAAQLGPPLQIGATMVESNRIQQLADLLVEVTNELVDVTKEERGN